MAASKKTSRTKSTAKRQSVKVSRPAAETAPSISLPTEPPGFLIVGIGASAGGLEALRCLEQVGFTLSAGRDSAEEPFLPELLCWNRRFLTSALGP